MKIKEMWQVKCVNGWTYVGDWRFWGDPEGMILVKFRRSQLRELLSCLTRRSRTDNFTYLYGSNLVRVASEEHNSNIYCHEAYIPSIIKTLENLR